MTDQNNLDRSDEYFEGLVQRLGWDVRDGKSMLVHCAGVSFRQEALEKTRPLCRFDWTPKVELRPETPDQQVGYEDANAVRVYVGTSSHELTGEQVMEHVGYIPKKRCPNCAKSFSGKAASKQVCNGCDAEIGIGSEWEEIADSAKYIRYLLELGTALPCGLDNVTSSSAGNTLGCDIWIQLP